MGGDLTVMVELQFGKPWSSGHLMDQEPLSERLSTSITRKSKKMAFGRRYRPRSELQLEIFLRRQLKSLRSYE